MDSSFLQWMLRFLAKMEYSTHAHVHTYTYIHMHTHNKNTHTHARTLKQKRSTSVQPRRRDPECMVYHIFMRTGCHNVAHIEEINWDELLNFLLKNQNLSPEKIAITTKRGRSFKKWILSETPLVHNSRKEREVLSRYLFSEQAFLVFFKSTPVLTLLGLIGIHLILYSQYGCDLEPTRKNKVSLVRLNPPNLCIFK